MTIIKEHCNETELCICKDCMKKFEDSVNKVDEDTKKLIQEIDAQKKVGANTNSFKRLFVKKQVQELGEK